jgi:hypothetical protein
LLGIHPKPQQQRIYEYNGNEQKAMERNSAFISQTGVFPMKRFFILATLVATVAAGYLTMSRPTPVDASSHRDAPLISNDPLADNTDLYVFRSPDKPNTVTIIANYIPLELPEGGPNYATFGENIRYEIHVKNKTSVAALGAATDDITYRFTFKQINEDPTTFFNIRLGKENLKTTYTCEKSTDGGRTFTAVVQNGVVPPNNIGPRSIDGAAGKGATYASIVQAAISTASSGETATMPMILQMRVMLLLASIHTQSVCKFLSKCCKKTASLSAKPQTH